MTILNLAESLTGDTPDTVIADGGRAGRGSNYPTEEWRRETSNQRLFGGGYNNKCGRKRSGSGALVALVGDQPSDICSSGPIMECFQQRYPLRRLAIPKVSPLPNRRRQEPRVLPALIAASTESSSCQSSSESAGP